MSKVLVAYFSAEGNTAKVAKSLAEAVGADLFEIKPAQPYTEADINWKNPLSRCNREKFGGKDVPVDGAVENFAEYNMVFIGFPIWYYAAPNIINTFVKAYDWSGKRIALFATSGGSDIVKSPDKLRPYLNGKGEIVGARLFSVSAGAEELGAWAKPIIMPWIAEESKREHGSPDITDRTTGAAPMRFIEKDFSEVAGEYRDRFSRARSMDKDFPEQNK